MPGTLSDLSTALTVLLLAFGATQPAAAQIDYRNLDQDRPIATEDAYPIERFAFDVAVPYRFETATGSRVHTIAPEVAYGLISNMHLGLHAPIVAVDPGPDTKWGLATLQIFALYNFNTEGHWLPALAFGGEVGVPVGSLGGDATRASLKAVATRSWGVTRAHLNAAWGVGRDAAVVAVEPLPRWSASLAVDHTFIRQSLLVVAEIAANQDVRDAPTAVNAAIGARWQWTPTLVLDGGLTRRLRRGVGPDLALSVGFSHVFALPGLIRTGGGR